MLKRMRSSTKNRHCEERSDVAIHSIKTERLYTYQAFQAWYTGSLPRANALLWMTFLFLLLPFAYSTYAEEKEKILPRFATIKSNHVNARTGPGIGYPIEWVFISRGEPIKITAEFDQWRKVEDLNGPVGWIHSSILSPKRAVIIKCKDQHILLKSPKKDSRIVAKLENGLRCSLDKIENKWCKLKCKTYKGWVETRYVWGISDLEATGE